MDSRKKLLIISIIFFLLFILITVLYFLFSNRRAPSIPTTTFPTPTSIETLPSIEISPASSLSLLAIDPPEDSIGEKNYAPLKLIIFRFSKPIDLSKVRIEVSPQHEVEIKHGTSQNEIVVSPISPLFWEPEMLYTITIFKGAMGIDGSALEKDISYRIKTKLPQNPF